MADKDKYGIPTAGNPGPAYIAKKWQGLSWQLTWEEMIAAVTLGGWPDTMRGMAAAVAAAESSRNPFIYNTLKKGHFGLFQISRSAHPEFFTPGGEGMDWVSPVANAKKGYEIYKSQGWGAWSAKTNGGYLAFYPQALEAVANFDRKKGLHGGDEKAWMQSLFRKGTTERMMGAYLSGIPEKDIPKGALGKQLLSGIIGAAHGTAEGTVAAGDATVSAVGDMAQVVTGLWNALTNPSLWMRLGYGSLGVILIGGGLFLIVRNQPAVSKTAKTVASVVPGGAIAKGA